MPSLHRKASSWLSAQIHTNGDNDRRHDSKALPREARIDGRVSRNDSAQPADSSALVQKKRASWSAALALLASSDDLRNVQALQAGSNDETKDTSNDSGAPLKRSNFNRARAQTLLSQGLNHHPPSPPPPESRRSSESGRDPSDSVAPMEVTYKGDKDGQEAASSNSDLEELNKSDISIPIPQRSDARPTPVPRSAASPMSPIAHMPVQQTEPGVIASHADWDSCEWSPQAQPESSKSPVTDSRPHNTSQPVDSSKRHTVCDPADLIQPTVIRHDRRRAIRSRLSRLGLSDNNTSKSYKPPAVQPPTQPHNADPTCPTWAADLNPIAHDDYADEIRTAFGIKASEAQHQHRDDESRFFRDFVNDIRQLPGPSLGCTSCHGTCLGEPGRNRANSAPLQSMRTRLDEIRRDVANGEDDGGVAGSKHCTNPF